MAYASNDGVQLYYEIDGDDNADTEGTTVFIGDLGYGAWQWGWQYPAVAGEYTAIVPELRGTGRSDSPAGPYSVSTFIDDLMIVLADAEVTSVHLVGAGLGGMIGLAIARQHARVTSLTVIGTAPAATMRKQNADADLETLWAPPTDRESLTESVEAAVSSSFSHRHPDVIDRIVEWRVDEDASRPAWESQVAAIHEFDLTDCLYEITVPTLVIHGMADTVWPPTAAKQLAMELPRGEWAPIEDAGHLVHAEASRVVNDTLIGFLTDH
ncbi:alpha/beta fold hydrolase [Haloquadratum walsbyi]|jgi:Predicted hydrolases or acyltransferases (alpha/beta hydrolase superfamily)|uniref:Putative hydrolase or acyltransferases (Alpha/beta hydrolase superfamily) n=1 Tax=Haloquadratum walsbyi J07HQW2 TaxID=1238425 RepID=U1NG93_9EURY|nr:alpha/beta fold hydrolase [Haloquadratum walsbyi]ERG95843.1 MAG: putative hydrolase or acyltransferases (alpha/beta hydrolase superfamily) [Haloquadratum walsbyi J07HQW2]